MCAEFWAVSSKTGKTVSPHSQGCVAHSCDINSKIKYEEMLIYWKKNKYICIFSGENVQEFFFRVAALAFERSILKDMENGVPSSIGHSDSISKTSHL